MDSIENYFKTHKKVQEYNNQLENPNYVYFVREQLENRIKKGHYQK